MTTRGVSKGPLRDLLREAERQGWTVTITGSGHVKATSPTGAVVFTPVTPSEYRGLKNVRAKFRRAGLDV